MLSNRHRKGSVAFVRRMISGAVAGAAGYYRASKAYDTLKAALAKGAKLGARIRAAAKRAPAGPKRRIVVKPQTIKTSVGVLSQSMYKAKRKPTPQVLAMERVGAPQVFVFQTTNSFNSGFGFQSYGDLAYLDQDSLVAMSRRVPTGNPTTTTNTGVAYGPRRYVLESSINETTLTNMTTAGVEIEIFDIAVRRDIPKVVNSNINVPSGALTYTWDGRPSSAWDAGVCAAEGYAYPTTPAPASIVGSTPFDSQFFRDYFKVKKRTIVMLPQGGSHRHVVNLSPNRLIDETLFNNGSIDNFAGLTMFSLYRVRGLPVADTNAGNFETTLGETQINLVKVVRNKFTFVQSTSNSVQYNDNLTTPSSANIVNIGSGGITTMARTQ